MPDAKAAIFETADFYLAVYFKARGDKLVATREMPGSNRKIVFTFAYVDQDVETKKFYNKQLAVEPVSFISAIRELKGLTRVTN